MKTFLEVGEALWKIREGKLYRAQFGTFEEYCDKRWNITKRRAYQLMDASEAVNSLPEKVKNFTQTESHAAALSKVEPERRAEVVEKAVANFSCFWKIRGHDAKCSVCGGRSPLAEYHAKKKQNVLHIICLAWKLAGPCFARLRPSRSARLWRTN